MNKNSNGKRLLEFETCTQYSSSSAPAQTTATAFTEGSILDCQKEIEKCRRKIMNLNEILSNAMDALVARDSDTKSWAPTEPFLDTDSDSDNDEESCPSLGEDVLTNKDEKLVLCEGIWDNGKLISGTIKRVGVVADTDKDKGKGDH